MSYIGETWYANVRGLAERLHADQVDGCGELYIDHLVRTASNLVRRWPDSPREEIEAAILHDVFEDTDATEEEVLAAGVTPGAVRIARELVKPRGADYREWISTLTGGASDAALRVKLADNEDNRDMRRVEKANRLNALHRKYLPAKAMIEGALAWRANERAGRIPRPT